MNPSWRKPAGVGLLLVYVTAYVALVASFSKVIGDWHWALQALFYAIVGIVWIVPLGPLLSWMETGRWRARTSTD